jgi:hypothetical protein
VNDTSSRHPSALALDRLALGVARADVAAHVAGCEACRARMPTSAPAAAVPAWARQLPPRRRSRLSWLVGSRPRVFGVAVAAFACAVVVWAGRGHLVEPGGTRPYVGTKGGPELWLYVKRGDRVTLWNGADAVTPGDLIRLKVQPDRFEHVSVFGAAKPPGGYNRVYDGAIPSGEATALPFSLKVDAQPGDEALLIVLSSASVPADQVGKVLAGAGDKDGRWWWRRLVLSKTINPRDGSPP